MTSFFAYYLRVLLVFLNPKNIVNHRAKTMSHFYRKNWGIPGDPWGPLFQKCNFRGSYHDRTPKSMPGRALGQSRGVPGGPLGIPGGPWGSRGSPWGALGGSQNVNFTGPIMIGPPNAFQEGPWGGPGRFLGDPWRPLGALGGPTGVSGGSLGVPKM